MDVNVGVVPKSHKKDVALEDVFVKFTVSAGQPFVGFTVNAAVGLTLTVNELATDPVHTDELTVSVTL